jgi:PIN domain nuclease of toxin-antitoxin system
VILLLDTHSLLWYYFGDPKFSATARAAILDPQNETLVSAVNFWEIAIKLSTGKLTLTESFDDFIQHAIHDNGFKTIPIEPRHAAELIGMPYHHRDPFDRMLIAQAKVEGLSVVSRDAVFDLYPIQRIW